MWLPRSLVSHPKETYGLLGLDAPAFKRGRHVHSGSFLIPKSGCFYSHTASLLSARTIGWSNYTCSDLRRGNGQKRCAWV